MQEYDALFRFLRVSQQVGCDPLLHIAKIKHYLSRQNN